MYLSKQSSIPNKEVQLTNEALLLPKIEFENLLLQVPKSNRKALKTHRRKLLNRQSAKKSAEKKNAEQLETAANLVVARQQNNFLDKMVNSLSSRCVHSHRLSRHMKESLACMLRVQITLSNRRLTVKK